MRLMMLHTTLRDGRRSRSLANMTAAVRHAARSVPPPDLIVLPNCADPRIAATIGNECVTTAMCQALTATLSWQAREWGVWIASGHTAAINHQAYPGASLIDADGDAVLQAYRQDCGVTHRPAWARSAATALGVMAIDYIGPDQQLADLPPLQKQVELHVVFNGGPDQREQAAHQARQDNCHVCLMNRGLWDDDPSHHPPHTLFDPTGTTIAETESTPPGAVCVEISMTTGEGPLFPLREEPLDVE